MSFIVAKENPKSPEGWNYFSHYEEQDGVSYPMSTLFLDNAFIFDTKEQAATAYWKLCKFFPGYKIYNYDTNIKDKIYVT